MSDELYPLGLVREIETAKYSRIARDEFEAGNAATRLIWPAQYFKRRLRVRHAPLKPTEFRYLRSFYSQRTGGYDSFWFRDNINRDGNVKARFSTPLIDARDSDLNNLQIALDEVAPIRALPEWDEVAAAAGVEPLFWWDPNREKYLRHAGETFTDEAVYDAYDRTYEPEWQSGTSLNLFGTDEQYQSYKFTGTEWAKTPINLSGLTGTQPEVTVFCFARHSNSMNRQVLFCAGAMGSGTAVGLELNAAGYYTPFLGASETWEETRYANSPQETWRSIQVGWPASSNTPAMYVNGVALDDQLDDVTRNYTAGPAVLGAAIDGSLTTNPGGTTYLVTEGGDRLLTESGDNLILETSAGSMPVARLAHVMIFPGLVRGDYAAALHNLFAYQFGLDEV